MAPESAADPDPDSDPAPDPGVRVAVASAALLGESPLFIVPLGLKAWFADCGIGNVIGLEWWQSHRVEGANGPVEVVLAPVQHWSGRGLTDRMQTLWGGYTVFAPDQHLFSAAIPAIRKTSPISASASRAGSPGRKEASISR